MSSRAKHPFSAGFRAMIPITTGIIPFGAVMGTVCANAELSIFQTVTMNVIVYAGAAQLAAMDLMTKHAASVVVVLTGLIINLRFLLYSAALSPTLKKSGFWTKFFCAHTLTDQSYAVMTANEDRLPTLHDRVTFYIGTAVCMMIAWHGSVIAGFVFGNFAPSSWSLEYGVPLSFAALVIPSLKTRKYVYVAAFSFVLSIVLNDLPFRLGLFATALISIGLAALITRRRTV